MMGSFLSASPIQNDIRIGSTIKAMIWSSSLKVPLWSMMGRNFESSPSQSIAMIETHQALEMPGGISAEVLPGRFCWDVFFFFLVVSSWKTKTDLRDRKILQTVSSSHGKNCSKMEEVREAVGIWPRSILNHWTANRLLVGAVALDVLVFNHTCHARFHETMSSAVLILDTKHNWIPILEHRLLQIDGESVASKTKTPRWHSKPTWNLNLLFGKMQDIYWHRSEDEIGFCLCRRLLNLYGIHQVPFA